MDESSEPIAAGNGGGENNGFGTREAHLVGISPQENRRSATNALGEVEESESKIDDSPTLGSLLLSGTETQVQEMAPQVGRSLRVPYFSQRRLWSLNGWGIGLPKRIFDSLNGFPVATACQGCGN